MSIDLTTSRPPMYCTWLDVIGVLVTQAQTGEADFSNQTFFNRVRAISQIENYIVQATALVRSELAKYGLTLTGTPWSTPPLERGNKQGSRANIGNGRLIAVEVLSTADVTAVWKIEISTAGAKGVAKYDISSYVEGAQGTSKGMDADYTTTNGDVKVGDNSFEDGSKAWQPGDEYLFSVILATTEIWTVVTILAAAYLLNAIYTEESPNESRYGAILWRRGMNWLKDVQTGKAVPIGTTIDLSPVQIPYDIDHFGNDLTNYATNNTESYVD